MLEAQSANDSTPLVGDEAQPVVQPKISPRKKSLWVNRGNPTGKIRPKTKTKRVSQ